MGDTAADDSVLQSKRSATRYQILLEIAERQPSVNQQEVADSIGITAQAVSDYLQDLVSEGYVTKHARGRYEVTTEGVDWLITQTETLRNLVEHVSNDVIGQVEIETAVAMSDIEEGETVSLRMQDGLLQARAGSAGTTTAVAVTSASADEDVGVTNFEGLLEYDLGTVTIVSIPSVQDGGSRSVDTSAVASLAADTDLVAVAGVEATIAAEMASISADIRFGSAESVQEAALKGLDIIALVSADLLSAHTDLLREEPIDFEVIDGTTLE
ncbi:MAG: winged helix-turn-helix transcriptional regulator [Natrialbaceae archaeon]|nr:winged helix-turn-helix transcriptional regulator [Natrialbaceae archaeon]